MERIVGSTFCNDKGIGQACYRAKYLIKAVNESSDPQLSALKLTYSTVKLFRLLGMSQLTVIFRSQGFFKPGHRSKTIKKQNNVYLVVFASLSMN